ncbi:2-oxoacid:acceptor oxidoreductase subunit alpha [Desulfurivibrio alkaliphilus]|uniref:Pyruvate flavodoxin/ferredoxin oxidoreductase domain protein n=1 Tax=Desulfurivibrio alkaliphilus (strain DSM 19089 / UNIQEM U267 / AHT2) TaxID=589865 RepID=D6Z631_DESAT|nr:2-oxoacid:acceptor oxidoreductase subunit alpha [Desulfurivibrio alkaliphilus]ADH84913.1 pyruvate flavodoxin/ferredoxin oxidoreductase domain protein [Desulfurivibrio alkaliphilus AHT 2]
MSQDIQILIGGEAGQGLVTIGQLLAKALVRSGREIFTSQSYHSRIRGGHNTFALRVGPAPLAASRDNIDILVALNAETVELHQAQLTQRALIIADANTAPNTAGAIPVPFAQLGPEKLWNTAALALLGQILGLPTEPLQQAVDEMFGHKQAEVLAENRKVMKKSREWAGQHVPEHPFTLADRSTGAAKRLLLTGNQAIALGALAGGLKFCAFYPMTPATSIVIELISHADTMGCIVEQAEDEIAAINMAIGASYAGAPAMVATSGGGFALMVEGVSLAAMTETPVLVVVGQRPGPATGMPTCTEQADLEFVLHAGHGEFPRAILAPGSIEECWSLTARALGLTEHTQSPVFLLTDQFLADSSRPVTPFDGDTVTPVRAGSDPQKVVPPYRRYYLTPDGLSPRLLPGLSEHLVVADSDEHNEEGHLSEDYGLRKAMVEKRLGKLELLKRQALAPTLNGARGAELLLVCWGSSLGPVRETAEILRGQGQEVATLHFSQVWPLVPEQFLDILQAAGQVVCIEGNATGQFARLIRRETGFAIDRRINRYDGLPFTAGYLLEHLEKSAAA